MIKRSKQRQRSEQVRAYGKRPPNCGYCGGQPRVVSDPAEIQSLGLTYRGRAIWICSNADCDAAVGCHADTTIPLGTLANNELRRARARAHEIFDKLFEFDPNPDRRKQLYIELANYLELPIEKTHIGMFDLAHCELTAAFARKKLRLLYRQ